MRTIGVVTVSRSDYGIYRPVLKRIHSDPQLELRLFVGGMHLSPEFGYTLREIEEDGFPIADQIEMLLSSDTPEGIAKSMGLGTIGFAHAFARFRPDILIVLGDRFEMHSAAVAALPFALPIAHIHGGESTEGLIDEAIRHSITKMSHLHFPSTAVYARRIVQMGEEPWRVVVTGAPSLDNLFLHQRLTRAELAQHHGIDLVEPTLLVTYHPVTLEYEQTQAHVEALLDALKDSGHAAIFTYPNSDTYGRVIIKMISEFVAHCPKARAIVNCGTDLYFSLLNHVDAMVGNSSSGIIEAASFKLPVVNIGNRQRGRLHAENVIDVGYSPSEIAQGISKAMSASFRAGLADLANPYGDGHAADRIVAKLKEVSINQRLLQKQFQTVVGVAECESCS